MTQNNLGNELETLGERVSGTARLEEAVAAYREAAYPARDVLRRCYTGYSLLCQGEMLWKF